MASEILRQTPRNVKYATAAQSNELDNVSAGIGQTDVPESERKSDR